MENYYEGVVRYFDQEKQKKVPKTFLVEAVSFIEAETNMSQFMIENEGYSDFDIKSFKKVSYEELVFGTEQDEEYWFESTVEVNFNGEETKCKYLILNKDVKSATEQILRHLSNNAPVIKIIKEKDLEDIVIRKECCKECDICESNVRIVSFYDQRGIDRTFQEIEISQRELAESLGAIEVKANYFTIDIDKVKPHLGKRLGRRIVKHWEEDFTDEDTGEVVTIERKEVLAERGTELTVELVEMLKKDKIETVKIHLK